MSRQARHLDFDLNLVPFIDLLSTCICFLLMTAVWTQIGSLAAGQSVGDASAADAEKKPRIWVQLEDRGTVQFEVQDARVSKDLEKFQVEARQGRLNLVGVEAALRRIRAQDQNVTTAMIQPRASSVYEELVDLMGRFKKHGVGNLGVSPL
ncbi:MAG: biopolymer transporter ExbD [Bdellovibrio sp.]|nr:MAG: biopolymer transporter ExbD [Bdellovibrio sp.]